MAARRKLKKRNIKEDQLVTVALTVSNFVQAHFAKVVTGAVVLVAGIAITLFTMNARRSTALEAEHQLAIGLDQFLLGEQEDASVTFLDVADRYAGHEAGKTSMYFLGECYKALYRYKEAIEAYDRYLEVAGEDGTFSEAATIAKALCYEGLAQYNEAAVILSALAEKLDPEDARYPDVLFRTGVFFEKAERPKRAVEYYERAAKAATGRLKERADVKLALLQ